MIALVKKLWSDESGQGLIEYALIVGLISLIAIAALTTAGTHVRGIFEKIRDSLAGVNVAPA